ncbi:hypothetical protein QGM71_08150 [Virgibacillus sp. C22-A2]|uniref:Uncharacterized protein n=1 Tax=Virgibacillus tibetensis TaxID=3042313 RepID=A0ABU6KEG8_9BACI|nr:hypothetical protein [Virgibacillus sp. C22-A2]
MNRSILNNHLPEESTIYPFSTEESLKEYEKIQGKSNGKNEADRFWLFHFDQNIPLYWNSYRGGTSIGETYTFEEMWNMLVNEYELIPPLDNHMAITRFSNMEVGVLITTSQHLQTIQDLIGNSFEFEVEPFISNNRDSVQIVGNGLSLK